MRTVGISELKSHLSEYVRSVREGEELLITAHGEVVAELRRPTQERPTHLPAGLQELLRRGATWSLTRNDPSLYRTQKRVLRDLTARDLLDWDRADR